MRPCTGMLVVQEDGTPVICSEEVDGGSCVERTYERHRVFLSAQLSSVVAQPQEVISAVPTDHEDPAHEEGNGRIGAQERETDPR
jgi:hypothetical protein